MRIFLIIIGLFNFCFAQTANEYFLKAKGKFKNDKYSEAIKLVTKAIEKDGKNEEYYLLRADLFEKTKTYQSAFEDYNKSISLNSEFAMAYFQRALFYYHIQDFFNSINDNNMVVKYAKTDSLRNAGVLNRASAKLAMLNYKGAIEDCDYLLKFDSMNIAALNNIAMAYNDLDNPDKAESYLKRMISKDTVYEGLYSNMGFVAIKQKQYEKALAWLDKALLKNDKEPYALNNRGFAKLNLKDLKGAMQDINLSLRYDQNNSYAYKNRALVYIEQGETEKACEDLKRSKQLCYGERFGNEVEELIDKNCKK